MLANVLAAVIALFIYGFVDRIDRYVFYTEFRDFSNPIDVSRLCKSQLTENVMIFYAEMSDKSNLISYDFLNRVSGHTYAKNINLQSRPTILLKEVVRNPKVPFICVLIVITQRVVVIKTPTIFAGVWPTFLTLSRRSK